MRLEPEGLLIDSFHPGEGPHLHDMRNPSRRIPLGLVSRETVEVAVTAHVQAHGKIAIEELVREMKQGGD